MRRPRLFGVSLPPSLRKTHHLSEAERYDLLSREIPDFILSDGNPLTWQNKLRLPYILEVIGNPGGKWIADVGCGWGFLANELAARNGQVIGVDISKETLKIAAAESTKRKYQAHYLCGDAEALPLSSSFDVVTATDVLEHVQELDPLIAEASRILKEGGSFFFVTVNKTILSRWVYLTFGENLLKLLPKGTHRYDQFVKPKDLKKTMRRHDLVLKDIRGILVNPILMKYHYWFSTAIEYIGVAVKIKKSA